MHAENMQTYPPIIFPNHPIEGFPGDHNIRALLTGVGMLSIKLNYILGLMVPLLYN